MTFFYVISWLFILFSHCLRPSLASTFVQRLKEALNSTEPKDVKNTKSEKTYLGEVTEIFLDSGQQVVSLHLRLNESQLISKRASYITISIKHYSKLNKTRKRRSVLIELTTISMVKTNNPDNETYYLPLFTYEKGSEIGLYSGHWYELSITINLYEINTGRYIPILTTCQLKWDDPIQLLGIYNNHFKLERNIFKVPFSNSGITFHRFFHHKKN